MWTDTKTITELDSFDSSTASPQEQIDHVLSVAYFYQYDPEIFSRKMSELEELQKEFPLTERQRGNLTFIRSHKFRAQRKWYESYDALLNAHELFQSCGDVRGAFQTTLRIASWKAAKQEYVQATELLDTCRQMLDEHDFPSICKAELFRETGVIYYLLHLPELSVEYGRRAIEEINKSLTNCNIELLSKNVLRLRILTRHNFARALSDSGQFAEAVTISKEGLAMMGSFEEPYWQSSLIEQAAVGMIGLNKIDEAIQFLDNYLNDETDAQFAIYVGCYEQLGRAYFLNQCFQKAEQVVRRVYEFYVQTEQDPVILVPCVKSLIEIVKHNGNFEEATHLLELMHDLSTDHWDRRQNQELARLSATHEFELKKQEARILRSANQKLADANLQLKQLNIEQSEVLRIVAHDLRNPLAGIVLRADLVARFVALGKQDKVVESIRVIQDSADFITTIIDQLHQMTEVDDGQIDIQLEPLNMKQTVEDAIQRNSLIATTKQIEIINEVSAELTAIGDAASFQRVLDNLLSNGVKYSPIGGTLSVMAQRVEETIELSVIDQGVGIAADELYKLFTKFGRLPSSSPTADERSTGLGLYISKKQIEAMNGTIAVHSDGLNQGSTFIITLPAA